MKGIGRMSAAVRRRIDHDTVFHPVSYEERIRRRLYLLPLDEDNLPAVDEKAGCASTHETKHRKDGHAVVVPWMPMTMKVSAFVASIHMLSASIVQGYNRSREQLDSTFFGHRLATE